MSDLTQKIRSRGHWLIVIRPAAFIDDRVPYDELDDIVVSTQVRMRGWPVPYIDSGRRPMQHGDDWIGQDIDAERVSHYESWRFFTSGQFRHLRAVSADWRRGNEATRVPQGFTSVIEVWEILYYLTEVFELASRLALAKAGAEKMVISATLNHLEGRALIVGQRNRMEFFEPYRSTVPALTREVEIQRDKLLAERQAGAVRMARDFFLRFGWKPSIEQLVDHQRELTEQTF